MAAPVTVPTMMARKVPSSMTPLPQERRLAGSSSGSKPYFDGPKSAACVATRASATRERGSECRARPAVAMIMEPISITLVQMVTWRLLKWSASQPPVMLKSTNGTEKRKVTMETKVSRSFVAEAHADDHGEQQVAQDVVAVCALELGGDERPESTNPCGCFCCATDETSSVGSV